MGSGHSQTADDLYKYESAIKGIQLLSAFGASAITAPAVILALPFVGAYEYGRAREEELQSGRSVVDTVMGGLFGVIVSPLAPFYCFIVSMQEILGYNVNHQKKMITKKYLSRADNVIRLDFSHYNVAITGCPGTGKSSLLNGLMGYRNTHTKAAIVGETETTMAPKKYDHPILHSLVLWDMPGIGTSSHPSDTYFERYCLGAFDAVLIVFDERLMASDVEMARRAALYDIPVFFIRNKADLSLERKMSRMKSRQLSDTEKWALAVSELTKEVKDTIYKNMKKFGLDTEHLYIVSSLVLQDFVIMLRDKRSTSKTTRIIHEKVLITNLLDALAERKDRKYEGAHPDDD